MKFQILLVALFSTSLVFAQEAGEARLNRDLEVSAEVLETLLNQALEINHNYGFWRSDVEARYVPDMGVVFSIPDQPFPSNRLIIRDDEDRVLEIREEGLILNSKGLSEKGVEDDVKGRSAEKEQLIKTVKDFLADYGTLIQALNEHDRIVVRRSKGNSKHQKIAWAMAAGAKNKKTLLTEPRGLQISASMADILALENGEIDRETFDGRVTVKEETDEEMKEEPELAVFGSILYRVFKADFSKTYYMDSSPWHERLSDFGVTYHVKVYSSSSDDGKHYITTLDRGNLSQQERNEIVEGMYDDFVASFKENVLDYGHALRNLDDDEVLVFAINLTECKGCDMPDEIELSVKKSVLTQYRKDELSLEEAMNEFSLKKVR